MRVLNQQTNVVGLQLVVKAGSMSENRWYLLDAVGDEALDLRIKTWREIGADRWVMEGACAMWKEKNEKKLLECLYGRLKEQKRVVGKQKFWEELKEEIREEIMWERNIEEIIHFNPSYMDHCDETHPFLDGGNNNSYTDNQTRRHRYSTGSGEGLSPFESERQFPQTHEIQDQKERLSDYRGIPHISEYYLYCETVIRYNDLKTKIDSKHRYQVPYLPNKTICITNREISVGNVLNGFSSYVIYVNASNQSLDTFITANYGKIDSQIGTVGRVSCYIITLSIRETGYHFHQNRINSYNNIQILNSQQHLILYGSKCYVNLVNGIEIFTAAISMGGSRSQTQAYNSRNSDRPATINSASSIIQLNQTLNSSSTPNASVELIDIRMSLNDNTPDVVFGFVANEIVHIMLGGAGGVIILLMLPIVQTKVYVEVFIDMFV
ncbi:MAG: hypothetical protein EZS28_001065 [Streblomastix strix]|uniref:Uncharacterized protein n=1 Tax=Streblomastix strix TaxID=222440 RepID=A0A5J4X8M2_9EUKA|nr:MAG: hypothetical protein EZS28_001065 [Streblomastix strix]